jgi:hypothetical protein
MMVLTITKRSYYTNPPPSPPPPPFPPLLPTSRLQSRLLERLYGPSCFTAEKCEAPRVSRHNLRYCVSVLNSIFTGGRRLWLTLSLTGSWSACRCMIDCSITIFKRGLRFRNEVFDVKFTPFLSCLATSTLCLRAYARNWPGLHTALHQNPQPPLPSNLPTPFTIKAPNPFHHQPPQPSTLNSS